MAQIVYFNQLSYFLSATFSKLCFLFMFLRIFPAKPTRRLVFVGIALSVLFPIAFALPMIFACRPISGMYFPNNNQVLLLNLT
jgi:Mn2+/Fe2+ NRAMP family transporter